jgi:hypothetical protein
VDSLSGMDKIERDMLALVHQELSSISLESTESRLWPDEFFSRYEDEFLRMLRFQVHETQDDPLLCVFLLHTDSVVRSSWKEELGIIENDLPQKLKDCIKRGITVKHVAFLGDVDAHAEALRAIENEIKSASKFSMPSILNCKEIASFGVDVASFVEILSSVCLLPHIEHQIRELEVGISASRRGLKNQLKSLLFRRSTSESSMAPTGDGTSEEDLAPMLSAAFSGLRIGSIEAEMRRQVDLLMIVRDYGTAISTLKLLSSDLKSDRQYFHYAAAQECLAVASLVSGGSISSSILCFKDAFLKYAGIIDVVTGAGKPLAAMFCTRVALQWSGLLASINRISEASWIIMRAHFYEENLRAAFLLEYSAHLLLKAKPPKLRKYAFYLVLAALRYGQSGENKLAFYAHQNSINILKGKGWDILEEHVHGALSRECSISGNISMALKHTVPMLNCLSLPKSLQNHHMEELLELYAQAQPKDKISIDMGVPIIDKSHISILSSGNHDYHDEESRRAPRRVWKEMETDFPRLKTSHGRLRSGIPSSGTSCAGENVVVRVPCSNPLKIPIEMDEIKLICDMVCHEDNLTDRNDLFCSKEHLLLQPGEDAVLMLTCRPSSPGALYVRGLEWVLKGVPCRFYLEPEASKWSTDPEIRPLRGGAIEISVLAPMPRLRVKMLEAFPHQILVGGIVKCEVDLVNVGSTDLYSLDCVASQNVFLEGTEKVENSRRYKNLSLAVGENAKFNIFLCSDHAGHQTFSIVWRYHSAPLDSAAQARFLRFSKCAYVEPSILQVRTDLISSEDGGLDDINQQTLCFQARTRNRSIQLESLVLSLSKNNIQKFDLLGISAIQSSPGGLEFNFEFDEKLGNGTMCDGVGPELTMAENFFLQKGDPIACERSILRWIISESNDNTTTGMTIVPLTRSADVQGQGVLHSQLVAPASLQHNFVDGPLTINIELQMHSKLQNETVDAMWFIGSSPLGSAQRKNSNRTADIRNWSAISWKCDSFGMQADIRPGEKRFVILEAVASRPGFVQLDTVYVQWFSRSDSCVAGSLTLPASMVTIANVSSKSNPPPHDDERA